MLCPKKFFSAKKAIFYHSRGKIQELRIATQGEILFCYILLTLQMGLTAQSPISLNHFSKMVILSNNESCKIAGLKWKLQFYNCSCSADQTNVINVFIINTFDIIQLST